MIPFRPLIRAAAAIAAAPAWCYAALDADTLKLYGGTYSPDCRDPAALRLRVMADALMVEQGNSRELAGKAGRPEPAHEKNPGGRRRIPSHQRLQEPRLRRP